MEVLEEKSKNFMRKRKNRGKRRWETPGQNEHILVMQEEKWDYSKLLGC